MQSNPDHNKGLLVMGLGGMLLSVDIPLIRLAEGAPWSILFVRSGLTFVVTLLGWAIWSLASGRVRTLIPGRIGLAVAALYAASSVVFILAVYNTATANLVFILAFNTAFSAVLSWIFLKERPRGGTLVAMGFMLVGVAIIVHEGMSSGHVFGDAMALLSAFFLSCAITISRGSGKDMSFTAILSTIVPCLLAASALPAEGFQIAHPVWIVLNGAVLMPVTFFLLAVGPRLLSGPEVAMFYLLETVFAPVWVWFIFDEAPSRQSMVGGTILVLALIVHSLWRLRSGRARTRTIRRPA